MAVDARDAGANGLCGRCAIKPAHLSHTKELLAKLQHAPFNIRNCTSIDIWGLHGGGTTNTKVTIKRYTRHRASNVASMEAMMPLASLPDPYGMSLQPCLSR